MQNKNYTHIAIPRDFKKQLQKEASKRRMPMWQYLAMILGEYKPPDMVLNGECYDERVRKRR
jgi:hypothetical protein